MVVIRQLVVHLYLCAMCTWVHPFIEISLYEHIINRFIIILLWIFYWNVNLVNEMKFNQIAIDFNLMLVSVVYAVWMNVHHSPFESLIWSVLQNYNPIELTGFSQESLNLCIHVRSCFCSYAYMVYTPAGCHWLEESENQCQTGFLFLMMHCMLKMEKMKWSYALVQDFHSTRFVTAAEVAAKSFFIYLNRHKARRLNSCSKYFAKPHINTFSVWILCLLWLPHNGPVITPWKMHFHYSLEFNYLFCCALVWFLSSRNSNYRNFHRTKIRLVMACYCWLQLRYL